MDAPSPKANAAPKTRLSCCVRLVFSASGRSGFFVFLCVRATVGYRRVKFIQFVNTIRQYRRKEHMARVFKAFKFDPQIYADFKELASKNGYTMTSTLEKFMADSLPRRLSWQVFVCLFSDGESRVLGFFRLT